MHIGSRALAAGASYRLLVADGDRCSRRRSRSSRCAPSGPGRGRARPRGTSPGSCARAAARRRAPPSHAVRRPRRSRPCSGSRSTRTSTPRTARSRSARSTSRISPRATSSSRASTTRAILEAAEAEADAIIWDGGNNDTPFIRPNVHVVVVDPHRAGHELRYHPGETNLRMAHVCVVNKVDSAPPEGVDAVLELDPREQPGRARRARCVPVRRRGRRGRDPRQARARDRGRADADARRDDLRRGGPRGRGSRRGGARRPAAVRGRLDRARRSRSTRTSAAPARDGLRAEADGGAARDDRPLGRRPRPRSGRPSTCGGSSSSTSRPSA